jgi:tetratricopeptide (TPR) repeat protein
VWLTYEIVILNMVCTLTKVREGTVLMTHKPLFPLCLALTASIISFPLTEIFAAPLQSQQIVDPSSLTAEAELLMAEIPDWVEIAEIPTTQSEATRGLAASQAVHSDQYMLTEKGGIAYQRMVYRISDRSALEDYGTMSIEWEPSRSKAILHRFNIIRDGEVIDVVEQQGDFSLFRREANLSEGILNGQITASMQIEDLRVGDMIEFSYSIETSYAPMIGHYQNWHYFSGSVQADRLVQRIVWPKDKYANIIVGEKLPKMAVKKVGKYKVRGFRQDNVYWDDMPDDLLERYYRERAFEISTFEKWKDVSDAFIPSYEKAMVIGKDGPLRDYVENIRAQNLSQREITEKVLTMVQTDIRYVGNFQGLGNYTPAPAASVYASKFGDCKGKTILLVAILRELGIDATPSLVGADGNDGLEDSIPMPGWFDHVFARVRIDGETYWLDGTRLNDSNLSLLPPVFYDYTLPLEANSELTKLPETRYKRPQTTAKLVLDSRAGFDEPTKAKVIFTFQGDQAIAVGNVLEQKSEKELADQVSKSLAATKDKDFVADSLDYKVDMPNKIAVIEMSGTMKSNWGDADDFRKMLLDNMSVGKYFHKEREEEEYKEYKPTPLWANASYAKQEIEVFLPENSGQIDISGANFEKQLGPAIYTRKVEQDGNVIRGYASTNIARGSYLPIAAKIWDKRVDTLSEDKVYVTIFGDNAAAAKRIAGYDDSIEQASSLADSGEIQAAANILNPLLDGDPNNVKLLVARGRIGNSNSVRERDLLRALLIEPSNIDALRTMAEIYLEEDNISLGKAMLERIIKKDDDHEWAKEQLDIIKSK